METRTLISLGALLVMGVFAWVLMLSFQSDAETAPVTHDHSPRQAEPASEAVAQDEVQSPGAVAALEAQPEPEAVVPTPVAVAPAAPEVVPGEPADGFGAVLALGDPKRILEVPQHLQDATPEEPQAHFRVLLEQIESLSQHAKGMVAEQEEREDLTPVQRHELELWRKRLDHADLQIELLQERVGD